MGAPVYQLLGGASRASIRTYNTCYDHIDFFTEPVKLARELSHSGIRAMKIWPFDGVARETGGQFITAAQMRQGIEPLRLIREEFGDSMDVAMESAPVGKDTWLPVEIDLKTRARVLFSTRHRRNLYRYMEFEPVPDAAAP